MKENLLGIVTPIEKPQIISGRVVQLNSRELRPKGQPKPASPDVLLAREAAARVEREDGYDRVAEHRLHGAYDGDEETRIVLATLSILRERGLLNDGGDDEAA